MLQRVCKLSLLCSNGADVYASARLPSLYDAYAPSGGYEPWRGERGGYGPCGPLPYGAYALLDARQSCDGLLGVNVSSVHRASTAYALNIRATMGKRAG